MSNYATSLNDNPLDFLSKAVNTVTNVIDTAKGYANTAGEIANNPTGAINQFVAGNYGQQSSPGQPETVSSPPRPGVEQQPVVSTNPSNPTMLPDGITAVVDTNNSQMVVRNPNGEEVVIDPQAGTITKKEISDLDSGGFIKRNLRPEPVPMLVAVGTAITTYTITKKPLRTLLFGIGTLALTNYVNDRANASKSQSN